jgi:hypothetical protein
MGMDSLYCVWMYHIMSTYMTLRWDRRLALNGRWKVSFDISAQCGLRISALFGVLIPPRCRTSSPFSIEAR